MHKIKWGTSRTTLQYVAALQNQSGKVLAVYPVTKRNENNVECNTSFGMLTIWNSNKVVVRGTNGRFTSFQL